MHTTINDGTKMQAGHKMTYAFMIRVKGSEFALLLVGEKGVGRERRGKGKGGEGRGEGLEK